MITLFVLLLLGFWIKVGLFAFKAAWGLTKVILSLVFLPILLIVLAGSGLVYIAVIVLAVVGLVSIISDLVNKPRTAQRTQ